jgi:hypothetical protein
MGNQAPRSAQVPHKFKPGDIVVMKPAHLCPLIWRPIAEHLEGQTFEYIADAQGWAGETLVLQPWPSLDPFPSNFLISAECLMQEGEWRWLTTKPEQPEAAQ